MIPSEKALDSALDTASQLHRSAFRLSRLLMTGEAGRMSMSKLGVMGYLYRRGTTTATEVAAYLRIVPQSLTRLIADLEKRRLITRRPNDADHRQSLLEITDAGIRLLTEDILSQRKALAQVIIQALTPAEQEMLRLAAGLMDRLATATEEGNLNSKNREQNKKKRVSKENGGRKIP